MELIHRSFKKHSPSALHRRRIQWSCYFILGVCLLHCSTLSPLRFISSGNIFNFCCMAAFAHCFIACWGYALSIISKVPGENTIKTKAKYKSKIKAWNKLRKNKNKCRKWYKTQRIWCERHRGIIYQLNVQILPQ